METSLGGFNIELYDTEAPLTVTNFLGYLNRGDYDNIIIHRSPPGFVVQSGGYKCCNLNDHIFTYDKVPSEFDQARSNIPGTIAMAQSGSDPNSATSEWFINVADNSGYLDTLNGGFTVFGHVLDSGMDVVNDIASLPTLNRMAPFPPPYCEPFCNIPLLNSNYVLVIRTCINSDDVDGACPEIEDMAPNEDGNEDGTPDREQANVTTFLTSLNGIATLATDLGMRFSAVTAIDKNTALKWLKEFTSPPNQTLHFNNGMLQFTAVGTIEGEKEIVLHDGADARPAYYYAYGPTADNPTPHWYDFSYDGVTGAEIKDDRIILHFVDNKRGDEDYTTNDSITHTGAQAVVTSTTTSSEPASGGCSISTTSGNGLRAGDWMLVSLFLAFVALARRRARGSMAGNARPTSIPSRTL